MDKIKRMSQGKSLRRFFVGAAIALFIFALGLWTGWHKDAISSRLRRGHGEPMHTVSSSPAKASGSVETMHKDVGGFAEGPTFSITEVKTTETPAPEAEKNLRLLIGIKKQPNAIIDPTKVIIQVFFYDTVDGKYIEPTDADLNYEWLTPRHDWAETNPEIVSVGYLRPKRQATSAGPHKYLGYRVLLYYGGKLEAVQAEPSRLLQLFPPPASPLKHGGNHPMPAGVESEQIPSNPSLKVTEVTATEVPDADAGTNLMFRIGVTKQPNTVIDDTKVQVRVFLFDTVDEKEIKLTDADVTYDPFAAHDWAGSSPAIFTVRYRRAKKTAPEATHRRYFGYVVRAYYDGRLQAVRANPEQLLSSFPPSVIAASRSPSPPEVSRPSFDTAADFAKYARKLREQGLLEVQPRLLVLTSSGPAIQRYAWKTNIVTTVFWVGEPQSSENPKAHVKSEWDANWTGSYGGFDNPDPSARHNYIPVAFIPHQNPFYCALPYDDVTHGQFKPEAPLVIPWFKQAYTGPGQSVCWHRWVAIRKGDRTCYAQWEDCGPFLTDHFQYVFGNERPKPNANHGAGLSVSPAVRDYLGLAPTDVTDWQFVDVRDVPSGPWQDYGENNHFVIARRQMKQKSQQSEENTKK